MRVGEWTQVWFGDINKDLSGSHGFLGLGWAFRVVQASRFSLYTLTLTQLLGAESERD